MKKTAFLVILMFALIVQGCGKKEEGQQTQADTAAETAAATEHTTIVDEGESVMINRVEGVNDANEMIAGSEPVIHIRLKNRTDRVLKGLANGFRVYSDDGATWTTAKGEVAETAGEDLLNLRVANQFGVTGQTADTIGFGLAVLNNQVEGIPVDYNDVAYRIMLGPISDQGTICIDSCWFPPAGSWLWAGLDQFNFVPGWMGPYCWKITK